MTMESAPIRLSIVVPNYNHGAVIESAIRAIATQASEVDEIIVVDDASTDDSLERLDVLAAEYSLLRVIRRERNQGAIAALNHGLGLAKGTYINFAAADDLDHPGLFDAMIEALQRYPRAAFACCEALLSDVDVGRTSYRPPVLPSYEEAYFAPLAVADLLRRIDNWVLSGTAVARRNLVLAAGGFDPALGAFADGFLFRQLALRHGFCFVPKVGMTWRVSASGLSRSQAFDARASLRILGTALERMRADPSFPTWYPAQFERRWRFAIGRIAALASPMNVSSLEEVSRGQIDRIVLAAAAKVDGWIGHTAIVAWLAFRERPTSAAGLMKTYLFRARRIMQERLARIMATNNG
jgi:glycosyltransferase involved in cell wall biosynthesis